MNTLPVLRFCSPAKISFRWSLRKNGASADRICACVDGRGVGTKLGERLSACASGGVMVVSVSARKCAPVDVRLFSSVCAVCLISIVCPCSCLCLCFCPDHDHDHDLGLDHLVWCCSVLCRVLSILLCLVSCCSRRDLVLCLCSRCGGFCCVAVVAAARWSRNQLRSHALCCSLVSPGRLIVSVCSVLSNVMCCEIGSAHEIAHCRWACSVRAENVV